MDCNAGRFFNSNPPPKSLKLYSPISIDSIDSQFNMWNDLYYLFDVYQFQLDSFSCVNEFDPIVNDFNPFNPSILNTFTFSKQLNPI